MSNLEIVILAQWALIVGKAYILKGDRGTNERISRMGKMVKA